MDCELVAYDAFEHLKESLPPAIKIGGVDYELKLIKDYAFLSDNKTDVHDGEFDVNQGEIRLATTLKDGKTLIDLDRTITVLLHEILHGIFYHYLEDFTENEEHLVTQLAKGLYQVLKENPELVKMVLTTSDDINEYDSIKSAMAQSSEKDIIKQQQKEIEQLKQSVVKLGFDAAYSKF